MGDVLPRLYLLDRSDKYNILQDLIIAIIEGHSIQSVLDKHNIARSALNNIVADPEFKSVMEIHFLMQVMMDWKKVRKIGGILKDYLTEDKIKSQLDDMTLSEIIEDIRKISAIEESSVKTARTIIGSPTEINKNIEVSEDPKDLEGQVVKVYEFMEEMKKKSIEESKE